MEDDILLTLNQQVPGSIPGRATKCYIWFVALMMLPKT